MITGEPRYLEEITKTHQCPLHPDLFLVVAVHPEQGYVIRCGGGHYPEELQKRLSYSEEYRRGEVLPPQIAPQVERRHRRREMSQERSEQEAKERLPAIYEASTGEIVARELRLAAIDYARKVGLVPELGHVCLYHGKPWVTIDGWYYRFRRKYPEGLVVTKPLIGNERLAMDLDDLTHAWKAEVYTKAGGDLLSMGSGYAREGEKPLAYKSAVEGQWPWRMAEKRAEEDALRKAVPLEIEKKEA